MDIFFYSVSVADWSTF